MKFYSLVGVAFATLLLSSCGSITRGTTEDVTIKTMPEDAAIRTSLGPGCPRSPCTFPVKRKNNFTAFAEREGYKPGSIEIGTKISGGGAAGFAGNVIAGGIIGMGVDAYNKSSWDHFPDPAIIVLEPIDPKNPKTPVYQAPVQPAKDAVNKAGKPVA